MFEHFYTRYGKRLLDIIIAFLTIILFSWLYLIIAVLVKIKLGAPVLFRQDRPGLINKDTGKEKIFRLYKFRSMTNKKNAEGELLPDCQRVTRFGKILRSTSLDELPEMFNVIKGDMSIIGPRPLLVGYLEHYGEFEHSRHIVRPGLTGLSQVNGRNCVGWKKRFELDVFYAKNVSFIMDLRILFMTVRKVIVREGIEFKSNETIQDYFASREEE